MCVDVAFVLLACEGLRMPRACMTIYPDLIACWQLDVEGQEVIDREAEELREAQRREEQDAKKAAQKVQQLARRKREQAQKAAAKREASKERAKQRAAEYNARRRQLRAEAPPAKVARAQKDGDMERALNETREELKSLKNKLQFDAAVQEQVQLATKKLKARSKAFAKKSRKRYTGSACTLACACACNAILSDFTRQIVS